MSCGLTAITTSAAPATASSFDSVAGIPYRSSSSVTRSGRRLDAVISSGVRQPEERSPEMSASPILPAPRTAIFRSFTIASV